MIDDDDPRDWRDLQERAACILREAGVDASTERCVETARGEVKIDVWAFDRAATPPQTYLLECKQWQARVPKGVVHAFRTVVGDSGANWGAIVSVRGFQKGAHEAARYSNVRLLTWSGFQELFAARWFERCFLPEVSSVVVPLVEYTEPINSRIFRKADALPSEWRERFRMLRETHRGLGTLCMSFLAEAMGVLDAIVGERLSTRGRVDPPSLPLRNHLAEWLAAGPKTVPDGILDTKTLRGLLKAIVRETSPAVGEFDAIFGGRA